MTTHPAAVTVLVASRNAKKLRELHRVLDTAGITGITAASLDEVPDYPEEPETGATFGENALIKARAGALATGLACLADDSGLTVDALNGMPGVLSARWSGVHGDAQANNTLLLNQLRDVPEQRRGAAFVSACALVVPDGQGGIAEESVTEGRWEGTVLYAPRGDNGFGYDPLFQPDGATSSAAELSAHDKDAQSHRGRALRALVPALARLAENRQ